MPSLPAAAPRAALTEQEVRVDVVEEDPAEHGAAQVAQRAAHEDVVDVGDVLVHVVGQVLEGRSQHGDARALQNNAEGCIAGPGRAPLTRPAGVTHQPQEGRAQRRGDAPPQRRSLPAPPPADHGHLRVRRGGEARSRPRARPRRRLPWAGEADVLLALGAGHGF